MMKRFYNFIRYHFITKKIAEWFLSRPIFLENPFYQKLINVGVKQTKSKPLELVIEPTNLCNLACMMCPHKMMKRGQGIMKTDLFKKIIDQAVKMGINNIKLAGMGEPLLDKEVFEKIFYAKKKNLIVKMFTNGMLLDENKSFQVLKSGLDELIVSIDGGSRKTQEQIRKGADYSKIKTNLKKFNIIRQEVRQKSKNTSTITANITYQEANKKERILIEENWGKLVDRIRFHPIHNWQEKDIANRAPFPCKLLFSQMVICWDGRVALCCIDYECLYELGNLNKSSLKKIWCGEKAKRFRKLHLERKSMLVNLCETCSIQPNWFFMVQS